MPDFRVADTAAEHPKLRAAGLAAAGLWSLAGAVSMRDATDGWVPEYWVQTWPSGRKHAARLIEVGLWSRAERMGLPGYQFHDWFDIQRSVAQIEEEKAAARERAKRSRERTERAAQKTANVRRTDTAAQPVDNSDSGAKTSVSRALRARAHAREATTESPVDNSSAGLPPAETAAGNSERAPHRAANVHDSLSLSLSPSGAVGGERPVVDARKSRDEPPPPTPNLDPNNPRCADHAHIPATDRGPGCHACRAVREQLAHEPPLDPEGAMRRAAVEACGLCDERGFREVGDDRRPARCDHTPMAAQVAS